jgi:large subunit ribosomal protein L27
MAHTKAGGSTKLGRDSASKRLGVKRFGGQLVKSGNIIVRQRGTRMVAGEGASVGADHTIFATRPGHVTFQSTNATRFTGGKAKRTVVSVQPE